MAAADGQWHSAMKNGRDGGKREASRAESTHSCTCACASGCKSLPMKKGSERVDQGWSAAVCDSE